jgi:hypothetical protein
VIYRIITSCANGDNWKRSTLALLSIFTVIYIVCALMVLGESRSAVDSASIQEWTSYCDRLLPNAVDLYADCQQSRSAMISGIETAEAAKRNVVVLAPPFFFWTILLGAFGVCSIRQAARRRMASTDATGER